MIKVKSDSIDAAIKVLITGQVSANDQITSIITTEVDNPLVTAILKRTMEAGT